MAMLLADVGGTNARLALARDGQLDPASITRFKGDEFAHFDDVVTAFLKQHSPPSVDAVCVAVAGPVSGAEARLTNRDWHFSVSRLGELTGASKVRLINDLTALGYATTSLDGDGVASLRPAPAERAHNGQSLVVGLGTGFNVCAVRRLPSGAIMAMEAEEGHTNLPANVMARLTRELGQKARAAFFSTEETFAGRGLSRLHALRTDTPLMRSEQIAAALAEGDVEAKATYDLFAEMFGLLCRELALRFMPLEGLFLAGSVGRSIADRIDIVERAMLAEPYMRHIPQNSPIFLICDDMAALQGCLAALGPQAQ